MKKATTVLTILIIAFVLVIIGSSVISVYGYINSVPKVRAAHSDLYAWNYVDYAEEVYWDTEAYPDHAEMGLFWTYWDETQQKVVQVPADSEEGAQLVDPDKPTLINVHGMLGDGHKKQEAFILNTKIANPQEFDLDTDYVPMNYVWMREGWNVGNFHYNRYASEISPTMIEYKIWTDGGETGLRSRHADGSYSIITEYTVGEHFAAEYIRAMQLLPDTMGKEEIRVAAHSMGGEVATAGIFLLTELAAHRQISFDKLPNRYALLDPYFSTSLKVGDKLHYMGPRDTNIRWSDKPLIKNNVGHTMIECLKDLRANGIAMEYYTFSASFLTIGMVNIKDDLKELMPYSTVNPRFQGNGYSFVSDGHNGVREWYLMSITSIPVKDITYEDQELYAPSAALRTEMLWKLTNVEYKLVEGSATVNAWDDAMKRV